MATTASEPAALKARRALSIECATLVGLPCRVSGEDGRDHFGNTLASSLAAAEAKLLLLGFFCFLLVNLWGLLRGPSVFSRFLAGFSRLFVCARVFTLRLLLRLAIFICFALNALCKTLDTKKEGMRYLGPKSRQRGRRVKQKRISLLMWRGAVEVKSQSWKQILELVLVSACYWI